MVQPRQSTISSILEVLEDEEGNIEVDIFLFACLNLYISKSLWATVYVSLSEKNVPRVSGVKILKVLNISTGSRDPNGFPRAKDSLEEDQQKPKEEAICSTAPAGCTDVRPTSLVPSLQATIQMLLQMQPLQNLTPQPVQSVLMLILMATYSPAHATPSRAHFKAKSKFSCIVIMCRG